MCSEKQLIACLNMLDIQTFSSELDYDSLSPAELIA